MNIPHPDLFRQQAYIGGKWCDADSGKVLAVHNPATGEMLGTIPDMGAEEARRAITAAQNALPAWRAFPAKVRSLSLIHI